MATRAQLGPLCILIAVSLHAGVAGGVPLPSNPSKQNCSWVAICPTGWEAQVQALRDFRASQGLTACIWTFQDLDDTYGAHSRDQIRAALTWAFTTWTTKPRWVVLVGEHYAGGGALDVISDWSQPHAELGYWEPNIRGLWPYMDVNDDGRPEMAVGRVPAASSSDVTNYVTKAIRHDQDIAAHVGYGSSALLVQDVDSNGLSGSFARSLADNLYDSFDPSPVKRRLYYSSIGPDGLALRNAANAEWDLGPGHVVVMGTGSQWFKLVGFWNMTHPTVAYRWLPNTLASSYRFPVLLGLSCGMNGTDQPVTNAFDYLRSVTEQLLFFSGAGAGASAVIAPSRSTIQYWNALIGKHLLLRALLYHRMR